MSSLKKTKDLKVGLSKTEEDNVKRLIAEREAESLRQLEEEDAREEARAAARAAAAAVVGSVDQEATDMMSAISAQIGEDDNGNAAAAAGVACIGAASLKLGPAGGGAIGA